MKARRMRKRNRKRPPAQERRAMTRRRAAGALAFAARLAATLLVVTGVFVGIVGGWAWITTTDRLAIRSVEVAGHDRATIEEIAPLTGLSAGTNMLTIDAGAIEERVESHPWISRAAVRRRPPDTVSVAVREWEPAALAAFGALYLVNANGEIFKQVAPADPVDMPVITGVDRDRDDEVVRADLARAVALAEAWSEAGLDGVADLSEVHLHPILGVRMTARRGAGDGGPMTVHLGSDEVDRRLERLKALHALLEERGTPPREVFLNNRARPQWVVARVEG